MQTAAEALGNPLDEPVNNDDNGHRAALGCGDSVGVALYISSDTTDSSYECKTAGSL
jgi:hypothetical protein